jgi:MOSC domain-containing protein YiiM
MDQPWTTGFHKSPVEGPIRLGPTNLAGDGQADLRVHGGPDRAVLGYSAGHYPRWNRELQRDDLTGGAFGENLTVEGLAEEDVCIGDAFEVGETQVQVSQPRGPCWKLARRWRLPDLPARVLRTGRTGWYFRVLREGLLEAGQRVALVERPFPEWTIARVNEVAYQTRDPQAAARLAGCPLLSPGWRDRFEEMSSP